MTLDDPSDNYVSLEVVKPSMTTTRFLCNAFDPPRLPGAPVKCPLGAQCALTGKHISAGYQVSDIVTKATADIADTFRVPSAEWVSEDAARLFKASALMRGNLLALPDKGLRPFVSLASATVERPAWRDLLRDIEIGTQTIAIVTDNHKRRLWPRARLSYFGTTWRPLFVAGNDERLLLVDVGQLRACLDLVESVYALGFSKMVIRDGLMNVVAKKAMIAVGIPETMRLERVLREWRDTDEFALALFVAQKGKEKRECQQN